MSDVDHQTASQALFRSAGKETYDSFAALRRAHVELRRSLSANTATPEEIRLFIARTRDTGSLLEDDSDRRAAQAILDYWSAELVTSTENPTASDYIPVVLAPFDANQAAGLPAPSEAQASVEAQANKRSREVIRFVAAARLWQDSGRNPGYLLFGDAIAEAAKHRDVDPDIADLVSASEAKRNNTRRIIVTIAATVLVVISAILLFEFVGVRYLSERSVELAKQQDTDSAGKENHLRWLARFQLWRPPYNLSALDLTKVATPGLRLHAPNFSVAFLDQVDFRGVDFSGSSFSGSSVSKANFSKAKLPFAQFRGASIQSTLFTEADLYRAIFDRACLNNVDFAGADLRLTSFSGVTFDKGQRNFRNTAWWFAEGWNADDIKELVQLDQSRLHESATFIKAVDEVADHVSKAAAGSAARATHLNNMAWRLATWGITSNVRSGLAGPSQACGPATGVPTSALDAAQQAVCIAAALKHPELANYEDTRAYILMQLPDRMVDAVNIYQKQTLRDGGSLFRSAIAQFSVGDKDAAIRDLKESFAKRHLPTHELQTLNAHITGELRTEVYDYLDAVWPKTMSDACRVASDAVVLPPAVHR